jgi:hypothetical protein
MNWNDRIDAAEKRGRFDEHSDRKRSARWPTCPCGSLDWRIPCDQEGAPKDDVLKTLGRLFDRAVARNNVTLANSLFADIKVREAEVLAGLEKP